MAEKLGLVVEDKVINIQGAWYRGINITCDAMMAMAKRMTSRIDP
jgi:hypothetical protein